MIDLNQENGPEDEGDEGDESQDLEIILPNYLPNLAWQIAIDKAKENFEKKNEYGLPYHWTIRLIDVVYHACADEARSTGFRFYFEVDE